MRHTNVTSSYNATNSTSTFCSILSTFIVTIINDVCCVIIVSFITNTTTANGIHSTHGVISNFMLLWTHCLLLFIWVTNNNGITFIILDHIPWCITRRNIEILIAVLRHYNDLKSNRVRTSKFVALLQQLLHPCFLPLFLVPYLYNCFNYTTNNPKPFISSPSQVFV